MITITIAGVEAMLNSDFSLDLTRSNPFFDRAGDFTYEVELSLLSHVNSRLYAGLKRPNSKSYPTGRRVVLRNNSTVLMDGTEILLSKSDDSVKIQIVANESKFNVDGGLKKLHDLNLPNPYVPNSNNDADKALFESIVRGCYPQYSYALPLLYKGDPGWGWNNDKGSYNMYPYTHDSNIPQPYLLWVIDKVIENMGYKVGYNYLATIDKYKRLCIANCVFLNEMKLRLPDWSVDDFFTEVEKFFGVVFLFDSMTNVVDIVTVDDFYSRVGMQEVASDTILDAFDVEITDKTDFFHSQYHNVKYQGAGSEFWNLADLDSDVYERARKENKTLYAGIDSLSSVDEFDQVVFKDTSKDLEWIYYRGQDGKLGTYMINQFRRYKDSDGVSENGLKIVPAVVKTSNYKDSSGTFVKIGLVPSLLLENLGTFTEIVQGHKTGGTDIIEVGYCIVAAVRFVDGAIGTFRPAYPQAIVSRYYQYGNNAIQSGDDAFGENPYSGQQGYLHEQDYLDYTLSLHGKHGRVEKDLKNDISVDTTVRYTFRFISRSWLSPKPIFLIGGRKYMCSQLRYHAENCKLSNVVEGDFFPMI